MQERVRNAEAATDLKVIGTRPIRPQQIRPGSRAAETSAAEALA